MYRNRLCLCGQATSQIHSELYHQFVLQEGESIDICSTPAPTPASTASSTNCTSEQATATFNAFYAANGSCASSTSIEMYSIIIDTECNSTCAATVQDFAQSLLNCNYQVSNENTNKKQDIATQFSYCETLHDDTNISVYVDSADNLLGSAAGVTIVVPNCTTKEIDESAYDIVLNADCASPCGRLIRTLGFDVPRCYFDHVNQRERLSSSWYQCEWLANSVNISINFHYSEILNATGNTTVTCNPEFDSTVDSDDNSLGMDNSHSDSPAATYQGFSLWIVALIVASSLAMQF